jgi:predicted O-methyltransferase YrrM
MPNTKPRTRVPKPDVCQPTGTAELPMLDVYMPMMKSSAIVAAGRLGLFEALARGPLSTAQLAEKIQSSLKGTATLADFLIALGYLEKQGGLLANTESTQRWFTSLGQVNYTPGLLWTHEAWPMMGGLAEAVRSGHPERTLWDAMVEHSHLGEIFSSYMAAFASDLGPDLLKHVPVTAAQHRLLDLGGSHGLHAIRFCRRYPQLSAVIVDLPSALGDTGPTIAREGLSERIHLRPGDLQEEDWGGEHDLVFYLSVAHNHSAEENRHIIERIGQTLSPGGLLVIHEYLTETPQDALDAAFRLTLLLETGTQTYGYEQYCDWLTAAGLQSVERIDLNPKEKGSLILARR